MASPRAFARHARILRRLAGLVLLALLAPAGRAAPAVAQEPVLERGVTGAALQLRQLDGVKRVLMIAAHPDDEDTALLTVLARDMGAEAAYLSLSRGEGGQNLIGPELGEGLGMIRTGELLAARRLDGALQYFARAYDFGFSKSAEETFEHWPREELLRDVVRVVRTFRPQVVVSIFSGTPADGHGHHQVAGMVSREAFEAAADPARFPEQLAEGLEPWQPDKLYTSRWFRPEEATLSVPTGGFDPLLGRSHHQVAMESRSQHRSQDMGTGQPLGPRASYVALAALAPGIEADPDDGLFTGVDTTLAGRAAPLSPRLREPALREIEAYSAAVAEARGGLLALEPEGAVPGLVRALGHLDRAIALARDAPGAGDRLVGDGGSLRTRLEGALLASASVVVRAVASRETVVPGQSLEVTVEVWNGGGQRVEDVRPRLVLPPGWRAELLAPATEDGSLEGGQAGEVSPGQVERWRYRVDVPADAGLSRPYFLEEPRDGSLYRWPEDRELWGLPANPPPVRARVELSVAGSARIAALRSARYVEVDKAFGEFTRPLRVMPAVSVNPRPAAMAWPVDATEPREVTVDLAAEAPVRGALRLEAPAGWRVEPRETRFDLEAAGESRTVPFRVTPDGPAVGLHRLRAVAELDDGRSYEEGVTLIDYPHIEPVALFAPAEARVTVLPVRVARDLRVGYIQGPGDDGAEVLRQLGAPVEILGPERVRAGDFGGLTTLVLGIRVYETRPDVEAANRQILDFARAGGTVIVQYNKQEYAQGDFAPYPISMAPRAARVTDPASPVELLDPESPLFHFPNRITDEDFEGWVQERGIYFLESWDPAFRAQLALTDPGEDPERGSLLVASVGEGVYVYTGLAFFRQFSAGVPGALRLFANLVSLEPAAWRAHLDRAEALP